MPQPMEASRRSSSMGSRVAGETRCRAAGCWRAEGLPVSVVVPCVTVLIAFAILSMSHGMKNTAWRAKAAEMMCCVLLSIPEGRRCSELRGRKIKCDCPQIVRTQENKGHCNVSLPQSKIVARETASVRSYIEYLNLHTPIPS